MSAVSGLPRWIELSWPAVPEADIVEYRVERSLDGKRFREAGRVPADAEGGLLWNEQGLADGETRYFRVKAVDRDTLESAWSDTATATAKPAPPAPGTLAAEAGDGIRLTWSAPAVDDIVSYTVWQKKLWRWVPLGTSEETGFRISAETVDQGITVAVSATDADGLESEKSPPLAIPAPPARQ